MKRSTTIVLATLWACLGCSYEPSVYVDTPQANEVSPDALHQLQGHWKVVGKVWSDCPQEWKRSMPLGQSKWTVQGDKLSINPDRGQASIDKLWQIDEKTFTKNTSVEALGCIGNEALTLVIDHRTSRLVQGVFSAQMSYNGSSTCLNLSDNESLPESCETVIEWQARRL